jgi:hypothetical protein
MVDMTALAGMITSLKAGKDIAEAMVGLRDAEVIRGKVFELQTKMLDAQSFAFAAHDERASLIQKISDLEKELANLKAWETEKQRYDLKDVGRGSLAYVIKESMRGSEPPHQICANCYEQGHKRFLQPRVSGFNREMFCSDCNTAITIGGVDFSSALRQSAHTSEYDPYWNDDGTPRR